MELISDIKISFKTYLASPPIIYPSPPKLILEYTVDEARPSRTWCTLHISGSFDTVSYTSSYFYSNKVTYSVPLPDSIPVDETFYVEIWVYATESSTKTPLDVAELTESVGFPKYSIITEVNPTEFCGGYLKAFCSFSKLPNLETYCTWEKSTDGINFEPVVLNTEPEQVTYYKAIRNVTEVSESLDGSIDAGTDSVYIAKPAYKVEATSELDSLSSRFDVLYVGEDIVPGTVYAFKMFTLNPLKASETLVLDGKDVECKYEEGVVLGFKQYTFLTAPKSTVVYSEFPNSASGKLYYSGNVAYSYGTYGIKNSVLASEVGAINTPISRTISIPSHERTPVTTLVAWKDYIIAATPTEMFLISKVEDGFVTKIISTFIGIPFEDAKCVQSTPNGILFKAHSKIYMLYPNIYSGNDTVLNLTDVSSPVENLIVEYDEDSKYVPFAFSTETAYYVIMPDTSGASKSTCLKYTYNTKVWTYYEYPVAFIDFNILNVSDIVLYGYYGEHLVAYSFEKSVPLTETCFGDQVREAQIAPIAFTLDSGQKSDRLNYTRQFVESKFNLATLHERDCFPMRVTVYVDGMPHTTVVDVHTDSAFWKNTSSDVGTLNTSFASDNSKLFNVFRQMFLRYSGKGRSVRHIIEGESVYPFKLYEINYRFKNLNIKQ